jgi:hypothetical protein
MPNPDEVSTRELILATTAEARRQRASNCGISPKRCSRRSVQQTNLTVVEGGNRDA